MGPAGDLGPAPPLRLTSRVRGAGGSAEPRVGAGEDRLYHGVGAASRGRHAVALETGGSRRTQRPLKGRREGHGQAAFAAKATPTAGPMNPCSNIIPGPLWEPACTRIPGAAMPPPCSRPGPLPLTPRAGRHIERSETYRSPGPTRSERPHHDNAAWICLLHGSNRRRSEGITGAQYDCGPPPWPDTSPRPRDGPASWAYRPFASR